MTAPTQLRIGTRASPLALWQAEHVRRQLLEHFPLLSVDLVPMRTSGDRLLDAPLHQLGGKGLFVKEIEQALLEGRVDLAVHSMKDVPARQPAGLVIATILAREDVRDALVAPSGRGLADLPVGAVVGSSSLRRRAQLLQQRPDLQVRDLRGNVATRLGKLDAGDYDAIVLAAAGLRRLGLEERLTHLLAVEVSLPAVGQGAIGIEIRDGDKHTHDYVRVLEDPDTARCVRAERVMNARLGGDCRLPVAALAIHEESGLFLRGRVARPDGSTVLHAEARGNAPEELGLTVAAALLAQGAGAIIEELSAS